MSRPQPSPTAPRTGSPSEESVTLDRFLDLIAMEPDQRGDGDESGGASTWWAAEVQHQPEDRVFGGLLLAQAVASAARTVPAGQELLVLQADFVRGVPTGRTVSWHVQELSSSPSMSLRRSTVIDEHGRELFAASSRWGRVRDDLPGFDRARPRSVPGPAELSDIADRFGADERVPLWWRRPRPVEFRPSVAPPYVTVGEPVEGPGEQSVWVRAAGSLPQDPVVGAALLAYLTDMSLLEGAFLVLGVPRHAPGSKILSLHHSLVLHRRPDLSSWLQFDATVSAMAHGRALGSGEIFDAAGRLVASASQVGLVGTAR